VRVAVNGAEVATPKLAVDPATGRVTFAADAVPPPGSAVTAGFEFDVPVRFDTDELAIDLAVATSAPFTATRTEPATGLAIARR
jgi:uncharacterized protein (TIGR02217 family)